MNGKHLSKYDFRHVWDLWHCGESHAESKLQVAQTPATEQKLFFYEYQCISFPVSYQAKQPFSYQDGFLESLLVFKNSSAEPDWVRFSFCILIISLCPSNVSYAHLP